MPLYLRVYVGLAEREAQVYDLIVRHFIASFYPDCKVSTTSVEGRVERVTFKVSGKEILEPGWRIVFSGEAEIPDENKGEGDKDTSETNEGILPTFTLGEQGDHTPEIKEKQTQPPKYYTEATLLRAMETAGKFVEDEELREAMKENGIGRPSTRANIIETLFKRGYIEKVKRSQIHATETGKQLISLINYELLKSASLTGQWEYKLRQIERKELLTQTFINELKDLLVQLTHSVLTAPSAPTPSSPSLSTGITCPSCQRGTLLRGRTAYGCSDYQAGCTYRIPFEECPAEATAEELQTYLHKQRTAPLTPSPIDNV